jgi:hypothetical protein
MRCCRKPKGLKAISYPKQMIDPISKICPLFWAFAVRFLPGFVAFDWLTLSLCGVGLVVTNPP